MSNVTTKLMRTGGLASLAVLLVTIVGTAQAARATKEYSVTIATTTTAGTYELTLTNSANSTHSLGSANVTAPDGVTISSVAPTELVASSGGQWTASLNGKVVELRAKTSSDALPPGKQVTSRLTLQHSSSVCAVWKTQVKQSNDFNGTPGNDFDPVGTTVSAGSSGAATIAFSAQPTTTEVNKAISPAVKVKAVDACGNPADGDVAIKIDTNPSGGKFSAGTLSQPLDQGVATFSDLKIDTSGVDYTLSASSAGISTASDPFDVVDYLCRSALICEASDAAGTMTVSTPGPPAGGAMGLSFSGFASGFACTGAPAFQGVGSLATIDPISYTRPIQVTTRWAKSVAPGTGVANFILCWSKTGLGYDVAGACTKKGQLPAGVKLCELKRNRNGAGDLVIEFLIAPEDPYAGLGR